MKHISILIPDGQCNLSTVSCVAGTSEILNAANRFWEREGNRKLYIIQTVSASTEPVEFGSFTLQADVAIDDISHTDLIIIPSSMVTTFNTATPGNKRLIKWIEQQYKSGAEAASICRGAYLLASTGLLNNRSCSTHWSITEHFRKAFPDVFLASDKLITDENGIYTNGGAFSFLHLLIYLVEKYFDRPTAIHCSKVFQIDLDRKLQSAFSIFTGQRKHNDEVILKAQDYIENNFTEKLSIEKIAANYNTGRRSFDRRFIKATGLTPLDYFQRVKVEAAKKAFETSRKTVTEVMYEVGYNDTKAFREVFSRVTGISPIDYKMKYQRTA